MTELWVWPVMVASAAVVSVAVTEVAVWLICVIPVAVMNGVGRLGIGGGGLGLEGGSLAWCCWRRSRTRKPQVRPPWFVCDAAIKPNGVRPPEKVYFLGPRKLVSLPRNLSKRPAMAIG